MNKFFYLKLAFLNIKTNRKIFLPYIISSIFVITMFYDINSLTTSPIIDNSFGSTPLLLMLTLGSIVVGIFSVILIIYVNNFISKKRYKEFGLYNILGLNKKHIAIILFFETLIVAIISISFGILLGILFSKVVELFLSNILIMNPIKGFHISFDTIKNCTILFSIIYFYTFLTSIRKIHLSNPIELLQMNNYGEKEPKVKKLKLIIGIVTLVTGYSIANLIDDPVSAFVMFFVAVILVIVATYFLFEAGTIFVLKIMRKNKKFYYDKNNFTTISGMLYRMKQNASGLASICILSTCMLVAISTTFALYLGVEQTINNFYPHDLVITVYDDYGKDDFVDEIYNIALDNEIDIQYFNEFTYFENLVNVTNNNFNGADENNPNNCSIMAYTIDEYNEQMQTNYSLNDNEVLLYSSNKKEMDNITLGGKQYVVKENIKDAYNQSQVTKYLGFDGYIFVVSDKIQLDNVAALTIGNYSNPILKQVYFDTTSSEQLLRNIIDDINMNIEINSYTTLKYDAQQSFYSMFGAMFFVGIFVGALFLLATVLIIYYKQVQEGYDDAQRFIIMQKVGMSKSEVKKTINKQVVMVFFLPIIVAIIHICFAYKMIFLILTILNVASNQLFMFCLLITIVVFLVIYLIVYYVTSKIYYDIVSFK